jgi:hypothetical protein
MDITVRLSDEQIIAAKSLGIITEPECQQAVDARFGLYVEKYRSQTSKASVEAAQELKTKYDALAKEDKATVDAVLAKVSADIKEG